MLWSDWIKQVNKLSKNINDSYAPDVVIPAMSGGLIPATIIAKKLGIKDIRPVNVGRRKTKRHYIYPKNGDIGSIKNKKVLIIEDDACSGLSIKFIRNSILKKGAKQIKSACVFKKIGLDKIDYFAKEVSDFPDYPWKKPNFGDR